MHQLFELNRLFAHGVAGGGGLLHQRGVLLSTTLIHLQDRLADLFDPAGLFLGGGGHFWAAISFTFFTAVDDFTQGLADVDQSPAIFHLAHTVGDQLDLLGGIGAALRQLTLTATTAKPRPCSPARAASTRSRPASWFERQFHQLR